MKDKIKKVVNEKDIETKKEKKQKETKFVYFFPTLKRSFKAKNLEEALKRVNKK